MDHTALAEHIRKHCQANGHPSLARLGRGTVSKILETVRMRKYGQRIAIAVTISPIHDSEGRITGASKIAREITQRKATAAALPRSEARFRPLVTATSQIVWPASASLVSHPVRIVRS